VPRPRRAARRSAPGTLRHAARRAREPPPASAPRRLAQRLRIHARRARDEVWLGPRPPRR
jgi:hypothetical protein